MRTISSSTCYYILEDADCNPKAQTTKPLRQRFSTAFGAASFSSGILYIYDKYFNSAHARRWFTRLLTHPGLNRVRLFRNIFRQVDIAVFGNQDVVFDTNAYAFFGYVEPRFDSNDIAFFER